MIWAPRPAAAAISPACFSIIACLILATADVAGSQRVAWIRPPRTIRAMPITPWMTETPTRATLSVSRTKSASFGGFRMPATIPFLVGGRWESSASDRRGDVFNPSTGGVQAQVPFCTADEIDRTVRCAAAALPAWSETPAVERARVLFRFRERIQARFEELAALVTREHGKTIAEARAEMQRGIEMVEFACGIPSLLMGQSLENLAAGVDCETNRHPLGVCVGITPFNFPSMVPLWMFPVAIACGNTFVLKPSEKVPLSALKLGELLMEAGLPEGIFNIVHGDKECVDALLT